MREDEEKMEQEKESNWFLNGLYRSVYEPDTALPNLFPPFGDNRDRATMERVRLDSTNPFILQPNQYHAYKNIQQWLENDWNEKLKYIYHTSSYAELSDAYQTFQKEFDAFLNDPIGNQDFLNKLARRGSEEKTENSRYVLWLAEDDDKRCKTCGNYHGKLFDIIREPERHPNCRCKKIYFESVRTEKHYLVVIFSGINTKKGSGYITALGEELKKQLGGEKGNNTVDYLTIASYDDTDDNIKFNDDTIWDSLQVYRRAYGYASISPWVFANQIINECNGTTRYRNNGIKYADGFTYDYVIFVGHSGGGVMASRTAETLNQIGKGPYVNKIIRIGSPELNVDSETYQDRTLDLIMPGDPIPLLHFKRDKKDVQVPNIYLKDMEYKTVNPIEIHSAYFDHVCTPACMYGCINIDKKKGNVYDTRRYDDTPTNMERTVEAIVNNVD